MSKYGQLTKNLNEFFKDGEWHTVEELIIESLNAITPERAMRRLRARNRNRDMAEGYRMPPSSPERIYAGRKSIIKQWLHTYIQSGKIETRLNNKGIRHLYRYPKKREG